MLLARLAVRADHHAQGIGGPLLAEALRKAVIAGESAVARLVVVDAIDEAVVRFYAHHGFLAVPEHPLRLCRRSWTSKPAQSASDDTRAPIRAGCARVVHNMGVRA